MRPSLSANNLAKLNLIHEGLTHNDSAGSLSKLSSIYSDHSSHSPAVANVSNLYYETEMQKVNDLEKEINELKKEINQIRQKMNHQELEQKLTYFKLIKNVLQLFNAYLCVITVYQTFKMEYIALIRESEIDLRGTRKNTLALLMLLYRAMPHILTKHNCLKAIRRSFWFSLSAFLFAIRNERSRNVGFCISCVYSGFCLWNFNQFDFWKSYALNIVLNVLHIVNRYSFLHGLTSYESFDSL